MSEGQTQLGEARELGGVVEAVRHHNEEDGWTVARVRVGEGFSGAGEVVAGVGNLAEAREGMEVRLWGEWVTHPQYGEQFKFVRYQVQLPMTPDQIKRYLASGAIKGIGKKRAETIVKRFGEETLRVFDEEPERLAEIRGISKKKAREIGEEWKRQREGEKNEVLMRLQGMGITAAQAIRIQRHYGDRSVGVVEENPYQLAMEVEGIGFRIADRIARSIGTPVSSPYRLQAGLSYVLQEQAQQGHCFYPRERLLARAAEALGCDDQDSLLTAYDALVANSWVKVEEGVELRLVPGQPSEGTATAAYLPRLWRAEQEVRRHLDRIRAGEPGAKATAESLEEWLSGERQVGETALSEQQAEAVRLVLAEKVVVLTGGPGVGKTTVTRAMVEVFENSECEVLLASPTGRAAKRLSEVTGRPARTIHRLLEIDPVAWEFRRNEKRPLEADVVIVDEASMLDLDLMWALVQAIPDKGRLILVGDVDQLPSVGPGLVLRDLIDSGAVPVARLTEIFRQDRESQIVMNAYRVNAGRVPEFRLPPRPEDDCVFVSENDPDALIKQVVELVGEALPGEGFSAQDIQVLTPMNKRALGTVHLNGVLQEALNPARAGKREVKRGEKCLREGDRVLQTVNNYQKEVFNGDVGTVVGIEAGANRVTVQFLDTTAWYEYDELDELELAYAITVHKAQGSEYPAVVMICHTSQYIMLQRNLLYTGLTRAQRKCVFVGNRQAVWTAVRNNRPARRFTRLRQMLAG
ncbi:MAG: ATP-dependent RecD-like DNA helicase [Armatimonadota bacterium]|nr:MAG: ATP-dependent RecD-like DNA helicase [Armatimonadota bacterium]